jgi:hypothetical protein
VTSVYPTLEVSANLTKYLVNVSETSAVE